MHEYIVNEHGGAQQSIEELHIASRTINPNQHHCHINLGTLGGGIGLSLQSGGPRKVALARPVPTWERAGVINNKVCCWHDACLGG